MLVLKVLCIFLLMNIKIESNKLMVINVMMVKWGVVRLFLFWLINLFKFAFFIGMLKFKKFKDIKVEILAVIKNGI